MQQIRILDVRFHGRQVGMINNAVVAIDGEEGDNKPTEKMDE